MANKIGVFDSGLGGLTILKSIIQKLPNYHYLYLGDNARVPYGGRSADCVFNYTKEAIEYLFSQDCHLIILACNTASALALRKLQQEYLPQYYPDRRILGVIRPTVETITENDFKRVGIIGTYATINSQSFVREIQKLNPSCQIYQQATPLLVPIIEEGKTDWLGLTLILKEYLEPLIKAKIEALLLGCTHYGIIENQIKKIIGDKIKIISQGEIVADKLNQYLLHHPEIKNKLNQKSEIEIKVTDINERYEKMAKSFFGNGKITIEKINLT